MRVRYVYIVQLICATLLFCWYFVSENASSKSVMYFDSSAATSFAATSKYSVSPSSHVVDKETAEKKKYKRVRSVRTASVIMPVTEIVFVQADLPPLFSKYEFPIAENYFYLFCKEINPPPPKAADSSNS